MTMAACWTWDIDPILLPIWGPLKIRWYGLAFLGVFYFGYRTLSWQLSRRREDGVELASRFVNWAVVGVIVGAWFGHRFFYEFDRVLENPMYLIDVSKGLAGLSSHGATIGVIVAIFLFARRYKMPPGELYDAFMWSACISAILVRLGNFFNSEIVGRPADVPWAVCLPRFEQPPIPRHPSQLYEVIIGLSIFAVLMLVDRMAGKGKRPRWLMTGVWFALYFLSRFTVEFFKAHQTLQDDAALTMGQYLSIPFAIMGASLAVYALMKNTPSDTMDAVERSGLLITAGPSDPPTGGSGAGKKKKSKKGKRK
ncbi:MAG: phosphatidylglycerol:prolipoprotein diacylglycerol transferase [Myxococcota bacterium]|jgi:phosphatidylglycerol:prolipoprotein diacylglycerol transferase